MKKIVFTCSCCQQVFKVPYFEAESNTPEEMLNVIEHEEKHVEDGDNPGWIAVIKEEE